MVDRIFDCRWIPAGFPVVRPFVGGKRYTRSEMMRERDSADPTLVAEMLRMTPEERLRQNDRAIAAVEELRRAFAARQSHDATRRARG